MIKNIKMNKLEKKEAFIHPTGINSTRDRNNDSSKPVSRHFNSFDHSLWFYCFQFILG